jgi:hypothetical protein
MNWKNILKPNRRSIILTMVLFLFLPTLFIDPVKLYNSPETPNYSVNLVILATYSFPIADSYSILDNIEKDAGKEIVRQLRSEVLTNLALSLSFLLIVSYILSSLIVYKYNKNIVNNKESKRKFFKLNYKTFVLLMTLIAVSLFNRTAYLPTYIIDERLFMTGAPSDSRGFPFAFLFSQSTNQLLIIGLSYDILFWYCVSYLLFWTYDKLRGKKK